MDLALYLILFSLGAVAGFGAGFIGLGGGILLFPLLIYLPSLFNMPPIDAKTAAALVISQVFFAGLIGGAAHWRRGRVHKKLTLIGALASAVGAFVGGVGSKWVSEWFLFLLFGIVTLIAGSIMFLPGPSAEQETADLNAIKVAALPLGAISLSVGVVVGLLGAGNFLFVPLLISVLKIPTRITIGSSLVIHVLNGFAGFLGKLLTGQVPLAMTLAVITGATVGALLGEKSHSRASPSLLRYVYFAVMGIVALRVWLTLLLG